MMHLSPDFLLASSRQQWPPQSDLVVPPLPGGWMLARVCHLTNRPLKACVEWEWHTATKSVRVAHWWGIFEWHIGKGYLILAVWYMVCESGTLLSDIWERQFDIWSVSVHTAMRSMRVAHCYEVCECAHCYEVCESGTLLRGLWEWHNATRPVIVHTATRPVIVHTAMRSMRVAHCYEVCESGTLLRGLWGWHTGKTYVGVTHCYKVCESGTQFCESGTLLQSLWEWHTGKVCESSTLVRGMRVAQW